jgi:type II secretory pathway pseudopilin PulG
MNLSLGPYHKICCLPLHRREALICHRAAPSRTSEAGYTLVALLALMTILALFAAAAAPSIRQQSQREREKEAIFRGEQVADAIRDYYLSRVNTTGGKGDGALPTSVDQLLEGIPVPGGSKRRQILRPSAARDALSESKEWRLIRPRSQDLIDFQRSVILYAGNFVPEPPHSQMQELQRLAAPPIANVVDTDSSSQPAGSESSSFDSSGPFVGVSSRSTNNSVLYYYGVDRHDLWIFTPLFRQH